MAAKRPMPTSSDDDAPAKKKTILPAMTLGKVASSEEMDVKILIFQNKQLYHQLGLWKDKEDDLQKKIVEMQQKREADDFALCSVNRYWNQLDSNLKLMIEQRMEKPDDLTEPKELECFNSAQSFFNFLRSFDQNEQDQVLNSRIDFTKNLLCCLLSIFDTNETNVNKLRSDMCELENIDDVCRNVLKDATEENKRLSERFSDLQKENHKQMSETQELEGKLSMSNDRIGELKGKIEDLEFDLSESRQKADKFERLLVEEFEKQKGGGSSIVYGNSSGTDIKREESEDNSEKKDEEIDILNKEIGNLKKELETCLRDCKFIPNEKLVETAEYKVLQSKFSVVYAENQQMRSQIDEMRNLLSTAKQSHIRQIEQMEADELSCQKKLRAEGIQLQDTLAQVRREYEMLRIEFEQNLAANEQAGPINREMNQIIKSLQNSNLQLKGEVIRQKRKLRDTQQELVKIRAETNIPKQKETQTPPATSEEVSKKSDSKPSESTSKKDERAEGEIRDLKAQLKKAMENNKEIRQLLDIYKGVSKEQRDKVQLMAAERRHKNELDELRSKLKAIEEPLRKSDGKYDDGDVDWKRKARSLEGVVNELRKQLEACRQEEEALLKDMELTGKAYDDMQEQNARVLAQLREKDDANFRLMSERIRANQVHKLLKEEKEVLADQVLTLQTQVEAQNQVVRKLEEKERVLGAAATTADKELMLRAQAADQLRRRALDSSQTAVENNILLDRARSQQNDTVKSLNDKIGALQDFELRLKRKEEECDKVKRRLERQKRLNVIASTDAVLREEVRIYKGQLTCPCCNVRQKDTVLTKCFHVFCNSCVRSRYDTRQRKCPTCSLGFGSNDFHRIYI